MANKIILANAKKPTLLQQKIAYLNTLSLRLYTVRTIPSPPGALTSGNFTWVVDGGAVSPYPTMNLGAPTLNANYQAQAVGPAITFTFQVPGGTQYSVAGFALVEEPGDVPVFCQDLDTLLQVTTAGQQLTITPQFLDDTMP
jgi:hypothetical protein